MCGILEYIKLGSTRGVRPVSLPEIDDGLSDNISVTFPMGNRVESQVQVRGRVYMCSKLFLKLLYSQ